MSRATPQMRNFAKCLIADEAKKNKPAATKNPLEFSTCEKLRPNLVTLMGRGGYHMLLLRSLALAQTEVPWLRTVRVKADSTLETAEEHHAQRDQDELFEGKVVLLAQLLGLLVVFIGKVLTLRLVREVWPKAPLDGLDFGAEGKNKRENKRGGR